MGISVRKVAQIADVSPAYVSALELGRNSTAGRPSSPSFRVIKGLGAALELDPVRLMSELATPIGDHSGEHALLYCIGPNSMPTLGMVERLYGDRVDGWLYIADPRDSTSARQADRERVGVCHWRLGEFPYSEQTLVPEDVVAALEAEVSSLELAVSGDRLGIAIADCSAVMRWVQNSAAEVQLEQTWDAHVNRIWSQRFGTPPLINVCAYWHEDIETVGHAIDQVGTALELIKHHDKIIVIDEIGTESTGSPAIRRILEKAKPSGATASSWAELADVAASALATRR